MRRSFMTLAEDYFFYIDETLARGYNWSPRESDELFWIDAARFAGAVRAREELRRKERIAEFITLLSVIHAEPGRVLGDLRAELGADETGGDDIGDMDGLSRLKRQGGRRHGS